MKIEIFDEFYEVRRDCIFEYVENGRAIYENGNIKIAEVTEYVAHRISFDEGYLFTGDGYAYPQGGWDYSGANDYELSDIDTDKPVILPDGRHRIFEHDTFLYSSKEVAKSKATELNEQLRAAQW